MFALSVSAVGTYWTFDDEESALAWADKVIHGGEVSYEDGSLVIYISDEGDPYLQHGLTEEEQFDAASFPFVKIRVKTVGAVETLSEFFWGSSVNPGPVGETKIQFNRDDTEDWAEYVIKIQDTKYGTWEGIINNFRYDPIQGQVFGDEVVYIDYIAFFATEEEALAWQPTAAAAPAAEAPAAEAPAETAAAAADETPAAEAPAVVAAQTSDLFSASIVVLAIASAAGVVICRKK
jgi:pyruvate/2-oxoglutarate dehydrogenase complex dihydrolipoamide acyltransferase (E2) component